MGCSGSKETLDRPGGAGGKLTIWGDHFSPETRTILSILAIAGVPHSFSEVNQFQKDNNKQR